MGELVSISVAQAGGGGGFMMFAFFAALMAVLWFLTIRPERKRQQEHQNMLASLKKGDEIVLTSGMFGKVHAIEDKAVIVEIADKTRVKVLKVGVHGPASRVLTAPAAGAAAPAPAADDKKLEAGDGKKPA